MAYYWSCPYCGLNLDPGERCDCQDEKEEAAPVRRVRPQVKEPDDSVSSLWITVNHERRANAIK